MSVKRLVQDAMRSAEKASTEECPVKMKLVAPPLYVLTTQVWLGLLLLHESPMSVGGPLRSQCVIWTTILTCSTK